MSAVGPGAEVDGRYRIIRRLGTGGMADVFLAEDTQLEREVALKLLHRRFAEDPGFVERFRREAQSAANLGHPNVVAVFDRGEWDGTYYIAMEYLAGRTLKQVIREEAPLAPVRAIDITIQILKATRFAHRRGIIHRDLKPHNVMLDDSDHVKVTDFGIARAGASDMTETGSIMGTAQYLSPEQAQGLGVGATSDLYSVGVILYEELTGRVPFDAESAVTIALKHVSEAPPLPTRFNPSLAPALEQTVMWSLNKQPEDRPQDADQFISVLESVRESILAGSGGQVTASMAAVAAGGAAAAAAAALPAAGPPGAAEAADVDAASGPHPRVQLGERRLGDPSTAMYPLPEPAPAVPVAAVVAPPVLPVDDPRRQGWDRWWPWLLALLVVLLLAGGAAAFLLTRTQQDTVPVVVNLGQQQAVAKVEAAGFSPTTIPQASTAAAGTVIYQHPLGGTRLPAGRTVTLTVSSGPGQTTVPAVVELSRSQAVDQLRLAGLKVSRVLFESSMTVKKDAATRTDPDAGTSLQTGQSVVLFLSSGVAPVALPSVIGDTFSAAKSALSAFNVVEVKKVDANDPPDTVIDQTPMGGGTALPGTTVTLTVAQKQPKVTVPNLVGQTTKEAEATLTGLGLTYTEIPQVTPSRHDNHRVLAQSPDVGQKVDPGSSVQLTVGEYSPAGTITSPTATTPSSTQTTPGVSTTATTPAATTTAAAAATKTSPGLL